MSSKGERRSQLECDKSAGQLGLTHVETTTINNIELNLDLH